VKIPYTKPIFERADVVLDPGHGGSDPGAVWNGYFEKDFNLVSCRNMKRYLERAGLKVALTRDGDYDTTLDGICKFSNDRNARVFYSKHHNWYSTAEISGREYFTFPGSKNGKRLANLIESHVAISTGQSLRRMAETGFYVLKHTIAPAILDEGGFMTNTGDLALMKDSHWMDRRDFAASLGIIEYLKGSG
jgi:N-acetylmuramoyl-L-alanine amidase